MGSNPNANQLINRDSNPRNLETQSCRASS